MTYSADFASPDSIDTPLDPTIMVWAVPLFWGGIGLIVVFAALVGWLLRGSRSNRHEAAPAIWEAINEFAKEAMKADSEALPARAAELRRALRARLGRTLDFGGELSGCVTALANALDNEAEPHTAAAASSPPAPRNPDEDTPRDPVAANAAASVTIITAPAASAPAPGRHRLSPRERNDALRLAVSAFNDYWRHRATREAEMRAVVAELSDPGPRRPHHSHGNDHH